MSSFAARDGTRALNFSVLLDPMEDQIEFSDSSDIDLDMALPYPPIPESPLSASSTGRNSREQSLDPEHQSKSTHGSEQFISPPSPLLLQPHQVAEDANGESLALQPSFDPVSTSRTDTYHEEAPTMIIPSGPGLDPQTISENAPGHPELSPQLLSVAEEVIQDDDGLHSLISQSNSALTPPTWMSDIAGDETNVLPVTTEQDFSPQISISNIVTSSILSPPSPDGHVLQSAHNQEKTYFGSSLVSPASQPQLEEDVDPGNASDGSTYDASSVFDEDYYSDTSSHTASLLSDVKDYSYENGRRYHSYREGHYVLPNDEQEQDRQDLLHHVRNLVLNGALFRAPIKDNLQRALDIGTGTGIWAIDFADSYPGAEVVGTDLSPIQPSWVPPNLRFLVDDAESPWLFSTNRSFDFIHARDLGGAIADWPRLLRQAYAHLRPGGWVELQEFEVTLRSDDDSMRLAPTLNEFLGHLHAASEAFHRPMNIAEGHRQRLVEAGFQDVRDEVYKVPSSMWPTDPIQKQIGRYNLCSLLMAVESYSLALFTRVLGWSNLQTQVFYAGVRRDLNNPDVHTYCNLHIVYGRKPEHGYHA
ncbi:hypothetical protein N7490_005746, partial [Penicillium lividum]